jgi:RIO kinase 1
MARKQKEEWKTYNSVFDNFTNRRIFLLASKGLFHELRSTVGPGKEAIVFSAAKTPRDADGAIAVKIYRLETAGFKKMYNYLRVDPRYPKLGKASVGDPRRRTIFAWTEREYRNLLLARDAHVRAPMPIAHKDNILLMEFIGHDFEQSPLLKKRAPHDPGAFFAQCLEMLERWTAAGMVHGDLSEYNIINHDETPVFIDFSHAAPLATPNAEDLLARDVKNLCAYFIKHGVAIDEPALLARMTALGRKAAERKGR